jgi:hypothetical protein
VAAAGLFTFQYSMHSISGARLHLLDILGDDKTQEHLRTHSTIKMTL